MAVIKTIGEVVTLGQFDNGNISIDVCTIVGEVEQFSIAPNYFNKVLAKWLTEGTLVQMSQEQRIIGKTTWTNSEGTEVTHGKTEEGEWKEGMEARKGEKQLGNPTVQKISARLYAKLEKAEMKESARRVAKETYENSGDAAMAKLFADIELA